jgi:uncharacterized protein YyaL (SSP411 family)
MPLPASCAIDWLPWSADAFERARLEGKPVLLSIVTMWSRGCAEMDRTAYADPAVAALVADLFVPVRVDADRRPDISSRYTLGGWPTTAFLTSAGEILGGGTFVAAGRLPSVLRRAAEACARAPLPDGAIAPATDGAVPVSRAGLDDLEEIVLAAYDASSGAFGGTPRFPHTAPVHLALWHARRDAGSAWARVAETCLDAIGWGGLFDEIDGGFFRCSHGPGWTHPQSEKLLEVNASLLLLYLDAFETLRQARYGERAAELLGFVQQTLADSHEGGWAASQGEAPEYYELADAAQRASVEPPRVDATLLTAPNALMASAALRAGAVMHDDGLRTFALKSLERVVLKHYRPGAGVARCVDGDEEIRGLLEDQVTTAGALLDAFDATGDMPYAMMAEELARQAAVTCRDPNGGGFFDRGAGERDVGLLRRRVKTYTGNCEAARVLGRLASTSGDSEIAALAAEALEAAAPQAAAQGALAAHYVLAAREAQTR